MTNSDRSYGTFFIDGKEHKYAKQPDGTYKFDITGLAGGTHEAYLETDAGPSNSVTFTRIITTTTEKATTTKMTIKNLSSRKTMDRQTTGYFSNFFSKIQFFRNILF